MYVRRCRCSVDRRFLGAAGVTPGWPLVLFFWVPWFLLRSLGILPTNHELLVRQVRLMVQHAESGLTLATGNPGRTPGALETSQFTYGEL
jgi:hypothetical protein